jgi:hypothetical protein
VLALFVRRKKASLLREGESSRDRKEKERRKKEKKKKKKEKKRKEKYGKKFKLENF